MYYLLRRLKKILGFQEKNQELRDYEEIRKSGVFDVEWYCQQYPDVTSLGLDPLLHYMRHGWKESRHPNAIFDTDWYLDRYPDVRAEGINPLLHYIRHGSSELRDTGPKFRPSIHFDSHKPPAAWRVDVASSYLRGISRVNNQKASLMFAPRILVVAELSIPQCRKYRVDQKCEMLRSLGYDSTILNWHDAAACEAALAAHTSVIFYRVPAAESVLQCIAKAQAMGLRTFWEVDDLIFDPNAYMANSSLKVLSPQVQLSVLSGVPSYRAAMLACDEGIASTEALAKCMREAGVARVHVMENALDSETLVAARQAVSAVSQSDDFVRIVYGSGTNTHDEDFREAAGAILQCLADYPWVKLRIIGQLGLPKEFSNFSKQIERYAGTSYQKYLRLMAECDIAIAPLEPTLFNDAKSNIKYLEAAIVRLPAVCSPRAEFCSVIEHGRNGMLAENEEGWLASLKDLIRNRALRDDMAKRAEKMVLSRYDPEFIARTRVPAIVDDTQSSRKPLRILAANVFFNPRSFGGATIVAEQMATRLNQRADTEVIIFTTAPEGSARPYEIIRYNADSIPVFAICTPETDNPILEFDNDRTVTSFREVLRLTKPDVVHLHSIQVLGASLVKVCEDEGVPVVVTLHDAWWICGKQFMINGEGRYCFQKRIDLNVCGTCVSDAGLNVFRQYRLKNMLGRVNLLLSPSKFFHDLYIDNGISIDNIKINKNGVAKPSDFKRSSSRRLRFGYVGGNSHVKGADLIRKVFSLIQRSEFELIVIDNMLSLGINSINPEDWPTNGDLRILPAYDQSNIDSFYSQIDVLLFPTQCKESFGLTVREALIRDIWVIATDAGGAVEDMVDGENGTIIPLLDDGTALRLAVEQALDNAEALMSHRNPHKARIVDLDQQAEELRELLHSVVRPEFVKDVSVHH